MSIIIKLTKNQITVIDDEDYELVSKHKWRTLLRPDGKFVAIKSPSTECSYLYLHRLIMKAPKGLVVDHINGDTLNNKKENLRICSQMQNNQNRQRIISKSKIKGVYKSNNPNLKANWVAQIVVNKHKICLGYFKTLEEASEAYDEAAEKYFGEFAYTNKNIKGENI